MTTEYSPHDYAMEAAFFADMERKKRQRGKGGPLV